MNGEEERNPLDVVRLVLGVLILVSLLTPNAKSSDSSNLREEEEIRRQKMEARSLTNKLTNDVKRMRETPSRYAYNVSGIFSGHWNRSSDSVVLRKLWIALAYKQDTPRLPNNSSLHGSEGSFSLQLYDQGVYREGIHQVNGMLTMIEGEQDSGDDALSLSFIGLYFIDTGRLSIMTNPYGGRLALIWNAPSSGSAFNVTNAYPDVIGYSANSSNLLYLNRRDPLATSSQRCLYRLDADLFPLAPSADPEITRNRFSRVWVNATGQLQSHNCGLNVTLDFSGQTMDTRHVQRKSRAYTITLIVLTMLEGMLGTEVLRRLLMGNALSASLLSFVMLAAIDLLVAMLHSLSSVFFFGLFSDFYLIAFGRLFLFSIVEMRVIFVVWRTRCPELNAQNVAIYQRRLSAIFFGLYLLIIVALVAVYQQTTLGLVFIALFYSFWLPQVRLRLPCHVDRPFAAAGPTSAALGEANAADLAREALPAALPPAVSRQPPAVLRRGRRSSQLCVEGRGVGGGAGRGRGWMTSRRCW